VIRGWYDAATGEVCAVAYGLGIATFGGTYAEFLERCQRMDEPAHNGADLGAPGWDANGSPTEEL
jgi:hypothetical protein